MVPTFLRALSIVASVTAGGIFAPVLAADSAAGRFDSVTGLFQNEVATGKLAGAVVLIQQHGTPIYLRSFGVRDTATGHPMTPDTIFALHSMTKPITSLAAMLLIDDGKLALSDPVSKYIPAFATVKVGVEFEKQGRRGDPQAGAAEPAGEHRGPDAAYLGHHL